MDEKLKPCPFCGGEAATRTIRPPMLADCDDICIYCTNCDVDGPHMLFDQTIQSADDIPGLEAEAIAAWNIRADNATIEALRERVRVLEAEIEQWREKHRSFVELAVAQVSKLGTDNGRKDAQIDALTADLNAALRPPSTGEKP